MNEDVIMHELPKAQRCQILGVTGMIVQWVLAILSFCALLIKRKFEYPKRSWKIWLLDNSKQAFGALLQHSLNMTLAVFLSKTNEADNCDWYFINFVSDVMFGVPLCYLGIILVEKIGLKYSIEELNTGVYIRENFYSPEAEHLEPAQMAAKHDIDYRIWVIQVAVWGFIVAIVKLLQLIWLQLFTSPLELASNILLGWLNIYPNLKLLIIMMLIPFVFNSLQFWIQDSILKAKKETNFKFMSMSVMENWAQPRLNFDSVKSSKKSSSFINHRSVPLSV